MIKLSIIDSKDSDRIGEFQIFKDLIYIGSNHDADIFLPQDEVVSNHIFLEIVDGSLLAHLGRDIDFILINGKRTTTFKRLKAHDSIKIGSAEMKILEFSDSQTSTIKEQINSRLSEIKSSKPELMELIKTFGDEV